MTKRNYFLALNIPFHHKKGKNEKTKGKTNPTKLIVDVAHLGFDGSTLRFYCESRCGSRAAFALNNVYLEVQSCHTAIAHFKWTLCTEPIRNQAKLNRQSIDANAWVAYTAPEEKGRIVLGPLNIPHKLWLKCPSKFCVGLDMNYLSLPCWNCPLWWLECEICSLCVCWEQLKSCLPFKHGEMHWSCWTAIWVIPKVSHKLMF